MENNDPVKLKPVVYYGGAPSTKRESRARELMLLKAMSITNDPKKLRQMIQVRTVADVYRTLDKMALRKEYHAALEKHGISFDFLVGGLKDMATAAEKDADKLKALQTLLKSVGMDKYDAEDTPSGGTWEDALIAGIKKDEEEIKNIPFTNIPQLPVPHDPEPDVFDPNADYEVKVPEVPGAANKLRQQEEEMAKLIYG